MQKSKLVNAALSITLVGSVLFLLYKFLPKESSNSSINNNPADNATIPALAQNYVPPANTGISADTTNQFAGLMTNSNVPVNSNQLSAAQVDLFIQNASAQVQLMDSPPSLQTNPIFYSWGGEIYQGSYQNYIS